MVPSSTQRPPGQSVSLLQRRGPQTVVLAKARLNAYFNEKNKDAAFADYDAVVIITDHDNIDYARIAREARLIVDTRDVMRKFDADRTKVFGLLSSPRA